MSSDDEKKIDASVSAEEVENAKAEIAEEVCLFVFIISVNDFIIFWDVVLVHMRMNFIYVYLFKKLGLIKLYKLL